MNISPSWKVFYLLYLFYRLGMSVAAVVFVSRFTSLGDAFSYQFHKRDFSEAWEGGSTPVTEYIGTIFNVLSGGSEFGINVCFMLLAYIGIIAFLQALPTRERKFTAVLILLPSFNLWTSIASKESIIIFLSGLLCAFLAQIYYRKERIYWPILLTIPCLLFYKYHYAPGILYIIGSIFILRYIRQPATSALAVGILTFVLLYLFRDIFDSYTDIILEHFIDGGGALSTREPFWNQQYDLFYKAPEGIFLSFFGPTFAEASSGHLLHAFSFIESSFVILVMVYAALTGLPWRPAYSLIVMLFSLFWILFPNYPFGVMNPGAAIRYRAGYYLIVVAVVVFMTSREAYQRWRTTHLQMPKFLFKRAHTRPAAP